MTRFPMSGWRRELDAPAQQILVDWPRVLLDLHTAGTQNYHVAIMFHVKPSVVQGWKNSHSDIGYGYGRALLALHMQVCGQELTVQRIDEAKVVAHERKAA